MAHQKGPYPDNLLGAKSPTKVQESDNQAETKNSLGFVLDTGEGKLPKITLEVTQSGKTGSIDLNKTAAGSRTPNTAQDTWGEDENLRDQYIQA